MGKLSRDRTAGVLHPRENLFVSGVIGALNAEIIADCDGCASVMLDLRGTFSLTIEISGTIDGVNWMPIPVKPINVASKSYVAVIAGTVAGLWSGACAGYRQVRARCTAYTSGAVTATLCGSTAPLDQSLDGMVTTGMGTAVGAASAAVTLTLTAPGAGLRHYLTYLSINRFASAVLAAAAAPVTVTTTNIPGALAFSIPADAAAQGTLDRFREDFALPIASSAQNAATTIVAPVTTGVIWRITAGFYVAP